MARSVGVDRAQVVAVAAELADAHGLEQLTLASVASRLGLRIPSLYNHVAGLPGLRRELTLLGVRQLAEQLRRAATGKAGNAAIIALAQAYRAYALARPGVYAATVQAPAADDHALQQSSREVVDVVLAVLEPYGLTDEIAIHAVRGLRSLIHGFVTIELGQGFGLPLDPEASFCWLLQTYVAGLRVRLPLSP